MTEKNKQSLLAAVSGFSGADKGTLIRELLRQYPSHRLSVPATTRAPRTGKEDGKGYSFVSCERSGGMTVGYRLVEYAPYVGNYYSTPRDYTGETLTTGNNVILEIEIQGVPRVKDIFPEAVSVFVTPPDTKTLEQRLTRHGTKSYEQVLARLKWATEEGCRMPNHDYLLVNDDLSKVVARLHILLKSQRLSMRHHRAFVKEIRATLNRFYLREEK